MLDDRVELDGEITLFPREIELHFADAYDKLLRATDGLDLARDLLAGVRDFHQAQVANDQNEVMKRLTVVASVLLLPTFIVGLYGQNLARRRPSFHWAHGYWWSWGLIIVDHDRPARATSGARRGSERIGSGPAAFGRPSARALVWRLTWCAISAHPCADR